MSDLQAITLVITTTTNVQEYTNMAALLGNNPFSTELIGQMNMDTDTHANVV